MLVVGVGAGRRGKFTESLVRTVLEGTGLDTEFISLSGKLVRPCEACNGCVETNRCVLRDDFDAVWERVAAADGLVFGAPTYWDRMNTKGAAFWERLCFTGRHRERFPLRGKPAAMVAVDGSAGTGEYVLGDLGRYFADARLDVVGDVAGGGEFACFTCGFGEDCDVGGFLSLYPPEHPSNRTAFRPWKTSALTSVTGRPGPGARHCGDPPWISGTPWPGG